MILLLAVPYFRLWNCPRYFLRAFTKATIPTIPAMYTACLVHSFRTQETVGVFTEYVVKDNTLGHF